MTGPDIFDSLANYQKPKEEWIKCERCGKQLYKDSTGNFHFEAGRGWVGVCYACLRPEED